LKGPLFEKLQQLILYKYAGGELQHAPDFKPDPKTSYDDDRMVDETLVLLGPKDPKLLRLLEEQINATGQPPAAPPQATKPVQDPQLVPTASPAAEAPKKAPIEKPVLTQKSRRRPESGPAVPLHTAAPPPPESSPPPAAETPPAAPKGKDPQK